MTEGTVTTWHVKPGDSVKAGDLMLVIETEKVATDVNAEASGTIASILVAEGEVAEVGATIAMWHRAQTSAPLAVSPETPVERVGTPTDTPSRPVESRTRESSRAVSTPLARRLARANGIDWQNVQGSGPRGRIKAADVTSILQTSSSVRGTVHTTVAAANQVSTRPATAIEKSIARRLTLAKQTIPHFYIMAAADMTDFLALRGSLGDTRHGKVTISHFFILALARALAQTPGFNAIWTDDAIVTFTSIDIGLAIDTPQGLFAPVLRDIGGCSLRDVVEMTARLVQLARDGQLRADDLVGGALTISNVGMHGASFLVPIINPPQSAILGIGATKPVFKPDLHGAPQLRQEVGLALCCDHRVHDGVAAARFLNSIVALLEAPARLLGA